jgi:hypothetical protein
MIEGAEENGKCNKRRGGTEMTNTLKSLVTLLKADEIEYSPLGIEAEVQGG